MAAFIPEDKIREVQNASDILEVISESVVFEESGKKLPGPLPVSRRKNRIFFRKPIETDLLLPSDAGQAAMFSVF